MERLVFPEVRVRQENILEESRDAEETQAPKD